MQDSAHECSGYTFAEREKERGRCSSGPSGNFSFSPWFNSTVDKEMEGASRVVASFERGYMFYLISSRSSAYFIAPGIDLRIISRCVIIISCNNSQSSLL